MGIKLFTFTQKHYAKGSPDRKALEEALREAKKQTLEVPTVIDGKEVRSIELDEAGTRKE